MLSVIDTSRCPSWSAIHLIDFPASIAKLAQVWRVQWSVPPTQASAIRRVDPEDPASGPIGCEVEPRLVLAEEW